VYEVWKTKTVQTNERRINDVSVFKRGTTWWYKFRFAGRLIRESAKTTSKTVARDAERTRRRELEAGYNNLSDREERVQTLSSIGAEYLSEYKLRHRATRFAEYALRHVVRLLGKLMTVDVSDKTVKHYQSTRLKEGASPKSINEEINFLVRLLGEKGDQIRSKMRREKTLRLKLKESVGKAYDTDQKAALLVGAGSSHSPFIKPALALAFNTGMRNGEIRNLTWGQIDLDKRFLTVGRSKSVAGTGRTIPLNTDLYSALVAHREWYTSRFGECRGEWFIFPTRVGKPQKGVKRPLDPTKPVTNIKTAWRNLKRRAGVSGRWHDTRHTLVTELAENGAGDEVIMGIAGHVSPQMLKHYSHIRMEAKRKALASITTEVDGDRAQNRAQSPETPESTPSKPLIPQR
jgi:integrase